MTRNTHTLLLIFLGVYFGEPLVARLINANSSMLRQLAFFMVIMALFRLISISWLAWGAVSITVLLFLLVVAMPQAVAIYSVTVAAYGVASALFIRIMVELWIAKHKPHS